MTDVFYFTGTGNSLAVARDICDELNGRLSAIPAELKQETIATEAETIIIVFPVYNHIFPFIIRRFINRFKDIVEKRIYAVCTFGDSPGIALELLDTALKEMRTRLSGGFSVKMPYNYVTPPKSFKKFFGRFKLRENDEKEQKRQFMAWKEKLPEIIKYIRGNETGRIEREYVLIERLLDILNLRDTLQKKTWLKIAGYRGKTDRPLIEAVQLFDYGFHTDDKCTSCGICEKVCPVENISLENSSPRWLHHCEQCFACLQWCPEHAIQFREGTKGLERYHHPDINLPDIINSH